MKKFIVKWMVLAGTVFLLTGCGQVDSEAMKSKLASANDLQTLLRTSGNIQIDNDYLSQEDVKTSCRTVYTLVNDQINCLRSYEDGYGYYWDGSTEYDYNSANPDSYDYAYTYVNGMETDYNQYLSGDLFKYSEYAEITDCTKSNTGYSIIMDYAYENGSSTRYLYETDENYRIEAAKMGLAAADGTENWQTRITVTYGSDGEVKEPEAEFDKTHTVTVILVEGDKQQTMKVLVPDNYEYNIVCRDQDVLSYDQQMTEIYEPIQVTKDMTIYVAGTE